MSASRSIAAKRPQGATRTRRNSFGDFFKSRVYPWRSSYGKKRSSGGGGSFKGYRITRTADGDFQVPELDRGSTFESKTEAKRFISYWSKNNMAKKKRARKREKHARARRRPEARGAVQRNAPKVRALKGSTGWMAAKRVKIVRGRDGDTVLIEKPKRRK